MNTLTLKSFDIPTLHRFSVGLDDMFDELMRNASSTNSSNYPPYNIIRFDENRYAVEVAVAGFKEEEIEITVHEGYLTVEGESKINVGTHVNYLHHGIARRSFRKTWPLGNYVEVTSANISDGILTVNLERIIPEALKPRRIVISNRS